MMTSNRNYDVDDIRRLHDDEHGNIGIQVRLTMEDLECLDFILQPPNGGMIDEPCVRIGELLWWYIYNDPYPPPTASIPLGDVERVLREHLEMELSLVSNSGLDDSINTNERHKQSRCNNKKDTTSTTMTDEAIGAMSRLSISDRKQRSNSTSSREKLNTDETGHPSCYKEMKYTRLRGTTVLLKPNPPEPVSTTASVASGEQSYHQSHSGGTQPGRLHDLIVSDCSDAHFYLLQPFEHVTIAACTGCTIVIGAVAGLLHVVDCEKTTITFAARRVLISNSCDLQSFLFTPSPPLLVGENRTCQFAPYNTYYDGMREDLLVSGLAATAINDHSRADNDALYPLLQCASNKWKQPIELSKLEVPQVPGSSAQSIGSAPLSPGADDRAMTSNMNDATLQAPVLIPPSEYHILFVPIESESTRLRRMEIENGESATGEGDTTHPATIGKESQYCRLLAEVLQLSPFRLPMEYERSALLKAERMKSIQQAVQKNLSPEQQQRFEEELNRGFRDWLVSSGNLRQVLDLVHMEHKEKVGTQ
jgi:TBCC domain-containing protein 1